MRDMRVFIDPINQEQLRAIMIFDVVCTELHNNKNMDMDINAAVDYMSCITLCSVSHIDAEIAEPNKRVKFELMSRL